MEKLALTAAHFNRIFEHVNVKLCLVEDIVHICQLLLKLKRQFLMKHSSQLFILYHHWVECDLEVFFFKFDEQLSYIGLSWLDAATVTHHLGWLLLLLMVTALLQYANRITIRLDYLLSLLKSLADLINFLIIRRRRHVMKLSSLICRGFTLGGCKIVYDS